MSAEDTFINYIDVDTPIVVMENICKRYKIEFKSGYWGFKKYVEDVIDVLNSIKILKEDDDLTAAFICCKRNGYTMSVKTRRSEILFASDNITNKSKIPDLRRDIKENSKYLDDEKTIKIAYELSYVVKKKENKITNHIEDIDVDSESINITSKLFSNNDYLISRITPQNKTEAIVISMLQYGVYINKSSNPLKQLSEITKHIQNIDKYIPVGDTNFMIMYNRNKNFFNVNYNWDVNFLNLYDEVQLNKYSEMEGMCDRKMSSRKCISFLENVHHGETFFFGVNPYCDGEKTIYHSEIKDIDDVQLISYGSRSNIKSMYYFTVEELNDSFKSSKILTDPINKNIIPKHAMNKLIKHINSNINILSFRELNNTIKDLIQLETMTSEKIKSFASEVVKMEDEYKILVDEFFNNVIDMGLYMRGWKILSEKMPLKSIETNVRVENSDTIYKNTCIAFHTLMESFDKLDIDIRHKINELYLLNYSDKGSTKRILGQNFNGVTICHDRTFMKCIHDSVSPDDNNDDTCIRKNSNWLLFTSTWYLYIFNLGIRFNFDEIDFIS